jgi:glutaredoxin 2
MIPDENLIEVKYEELEKDALKVIRRIYKKLDLPEFETTKSDLQVQLKKEKLYMKFKHHINKENSKKAEQRLEKYIQQWNGKPAELIM